MKNEIESLLETAKDGILNLSDFYKPEIILYFQLQIYGQILVGVLLVMTGLIFIYKANQLKGDYSFFVAIGTVFTGAFSFLIWCGIYDLILMNLTPKIYITKELIRFFN